MKNQKLNKSVCLYIDDSVRHGGGAGQAHKK